MSAQTTLTPDETAPRSRPAVSGLARKLAASPEAGVIIACVLVFIGIAANAELLRESGGLEQLPPGARVPDLLRAWGNLYNERLAASSPQRLKAIRLDMYRWEGGSYANYDKFIESWRQDL